MKKILIVVSVLLLNLSVSAQFDNAFKRHEFGLGFSSALLDGAKDVNQFLDLVWELHGDRGFHIREDHTYFWAFYASYTYHFSNTFSIEGQIKYKKRYTDIEFAFISSGKEGFIYSPFTYKDIAIPVLCNYTKLNNNGVGFQLSTGIGVTTVGLMGDHKVPEWDLGDMELTRVSIEFDSERSVNPFIILRSNLIVPFHKFQLKPFVSYSFTPFYVSYFSLNPIGSQGVYNHPYYSRKMFLSELEIGLSISL